MQALPPNWFDSKLAHLIAGVVLFALGASLFGALGWWGLIVTLPLWAAAAAVVWLRFQNGVPLRQEFRRRGWST
jgi:hypothetical protein